MPPEIPLEVWKADIPWGHADYERPVVFLGHRSNHELVVLRVSSKLDLRGAGDFLIDAGHENFAATNLDSTSYAEAQMMILAPQKFGDRLGRLEGKLREEFEQWLEDSTLE